MEATMSRSEGQEETVRAVSPGSNAIVGQGLMNNGGRVDIGAIHINNAKYNAKRTPAEVKRNLIDAFKFKSMTDRRDDIDKNYGTTCSWLTQTKEWLRWRREPSGLLWIKGHPGAGKSTIMKYAMRNMQRRDQEHVVAYFFDARSATDLNKSAEGLYRSLLVQFLQQVPEEGIFESELCKAASEEGANKRWSPPRLRELLEEAIQLLEPDPITVFIDALDECNEEMLQDTVDRLGDLLEYRDSQLLICVASRHFPHITHRRAIDLLLEDQKGHYQDVFLYIEGHLDSSNMHLSDRVRESLQKKARGSFIWAYLVIRILKDDYRRGRVAGLEARLEALPEKLEHLYKEILDTKEGDFRKETLICAMLVLLAQRSLEIGDLWWAIRLTCLPAGEDIGVLEEELNQMSDDDLRRGILDVSCGLVTWSDGIYRSCKVRFIHETTREFCLQQTGLLSGEKKAEMHEAFKMLCWRTVRFYVKDGTLRRRYPHMRTSFLDYAQHHILAHANLAQERGIDQSAFLHEFAGGKGNVLGFYDLIERLISADCSFLMMGCQLCPMLASTHNRIGIGLISNFRKYSQRILDAMNRRLSTPAALLYLHTERRKHEPHIYTLVAALQSKGLGSLTEFYHGHDRIDRSYGDILFDLANACSPVAAFFIVSLTPSRLLEASDPIKIRDAALDGFVNIFHFLLQQRLPAGPLTFSADEAMLWACQNGHTSIVKVLIEGYNSDLHIDAVTLSDSQPMVQAAWEGNLDIVELLLQLYKGPPHSLLDQVYEVERSAEMDLLPRPIEVARLLVKWRLDHGIPDNFPVMPADT